MRVLSNSECLGWFEAHNVQIESAGSLVLPSAAFTTEFVTPQPSKSQVVLAHDLAAWSYAPNALFWMSTWPLFEPYQMELFAAWRRNYGDGGELIENRGHLFDETDIGEGVWTLTQLLLYVMAFNWEGYLLHPNQEIVVWMGDDIIEIISQEESKDKALKQLLQDRFIELLPQEVPQSRWAAINRVVHRILPTVR